MSSSEEAYVKTFTNDLPYTLNDHLSCSLPKYKSIDKKIKVAMANALFFVVLIDIIPTALDFFQIVTRGERILDDEGRSKCFLRGQGLSLLVSSYVVVYGNIIANFYLIFAGCVSLICRIFLIVAYLKHNR